ncbi:hypothetical protein DdX_16588 [Ditylenchus destructor]|uniref:Uncharacterized protein n=1 Tax=Ditylenchus destructor TaxID=166010 RepID=A0AAD4QTX5_9BILA|nr:hypothetical protein DdX_16588 [Ditylenchus destructor]
MPLFNKVSIQRKASIIDCRGNSRFLVEQQLVHTMSDELYCPIMRMRTVEYRTNFSEESFMNSASDSKAEESDDHIPDQSIEYK